MESGGDFNFCVIEDIRRQNVDSLCHKYDDLDTALQTYFGCQNHLPKVLGIEISSSHERQTILFCENGIDKIKGWEKSSLWDDRMMEIVAEIEEAVCCHYTEIAYRIGDLYLAIQTVDDGYDYTFYNNNYHELDGGVYDDPDNPIHEAICEVLREKGLLLAACFVIDYDWLMENVEACEQERIQNVQSKQEEEWALLSEKVSPDKALNGKSRAEIEELVLDYAQSEIEEMGIFDEVILLAARVYGSRTKEGLYHADSDMDVVLFYKGDIREDFLFNVLHEHDMKIAGMLLDINPISVKGTDEMEEYMRTSDDYL